MEMVVYEIVESTSEDELVRRTQTMLQNHPDVSITIPLLKLDINGKNWWKGVIDVTKKIEQLSYPSLVTIAGHGRSEFYLCVSEADALLYVVEFWADQEPNKAELDPSLVSRIIHSVKFGQPVPREKRPIFKAKAAGRVGSSDGP